MFSTTITCLDAFPKVLTKCSALAFNKKKSTNFFLFIVAGGTLLIILYFSKEMRRLVDIATILSFLTSPFLAYLNYKLIYGSGFPCKHKPHKIIKFLAVIGMSFLVIFSIIFLLNKLGLIY